jgi:hypothetical protein
VSLDEYMKTKKAVTLSLNALCLGSEGADAAEEAAQEGAEEEYHEEGAEEEYHEEGAEEEYYEEGAEEEYYEEGGEEYYEEVSAPAPHPAPLSPRLHPAAGGAQRSTRDFALPLHSPCRAVAAPLPRRR